MFYKKENDNWTREYRVAIPEVGVFTEENKEEIPVPWFWSEVEPEEYKEWMEEQEKEQEDMEDAL